jgi:hypothetical protein
VASGFSSLLLGIINCGFWLLLGEVTNLAVDFTRLSVLAADGFEESGRVILASDSPSDS